MGATVKVGFVSVFPPNTNGIGDYTHDLCRAIRARSPETSLIVLGDRAGPLAGLDVEVDRCWSLRGDWVPDVLAAVDRARVDVVHLQHGYYMGRDGRVPALLAGLRSRGVRAVITLHAIYAERFRRLTSLGRWSPARFHRALAERADRLVIHQREGAFEPLVRHGVPAAQIVVIPHGTADTAATDPVAARQALGLPATAPIAIFLGFLMYSKGVDTVVRAFDRVAAAVPGARLIVVGRPERDFPNPQYVWWLERLMRRGRAAGWLDYRPGYIPADLIPAYLAAADVLVFPYRQGYGSASGILHRAYGAGRPVICSRGPKFSDARGRMEGDVPEAFADPGDVADWARSLVKLLGDPEARGRVARMSAELGRRSAWPVVAGQHLGLYRSLVERRPEPGPAAKGGAG